MKLSAVLIATLGAASFYIGNRVASLCVHHSDTNLLKSIVFSINNLIPELKSNPFYIDTNNITLLTGSVFLLIYILFVFYVISERKNFRRGIEHGSARWGTSNDIKPYMDRENFANNILLSKTERLTMRSRLPKNLIDFARNKNVLVVGGSGSGKTRFFGKPSLMQMHSSYVYTDPKGSVLVECGKLLHDNGYKIRSLNLIDFSKSLTYNPFAYIRSEKDILTFVNTLIANCNGAGGKNTEQKEDFWTNSERLLLMALVAYVWYEGLEEEKNIGTVIDILDTAEVRESDESYQSPMDLLFEELKEREPNHFAVRQYNKYRMAAGETAKSILVSVGVRLAAFDIKEVRELMCGVDQMGLDTLGSEKAALFVIIPDTDRTYNFIAAIMYTQLFHTLVHKADTEYSGRLPYHVRCILDEFANIGQIPDFETLIATIRSREISASIILQTMSQLKGLYKDHAETIAGNCDTFLFLGGKEMKTLEEVSKMLGKETIDSMNIDKTFGRERSSSQRNQNLGRELMTIDELSVMSGKKCIVSIRGCRPFFSDKYNITKHPNYKHLADYDKSNCFDIQAIKNDTDDFDYNLANYSVREINITSEDFIHAQ